MEVYVAELIGWIVETSENGIKVTLEHIHDIFDFINI